MKVRIYESDEFVSGPNSGQEIIYFECVTDKKRLIDTFEKFIKSCMLYEACFRSVYMPKPLNIQELEVEVERMYGDSVKFIPCEDFLNNKELGRLDINSLLVDNVDMPDKFNRCVQIYDQERNYIFHAAENDEGFYAVNWTASA